MTTITNSPQAAKNDFRSITDAFLRQPGLPLADVLPAERIAEIFEQEDAIFAQDAIFSTPIVLWAFLAQTLRDRKMASCGAAVKDIAVYKMQTGGQPPSGDTGDYCRARAKLDENALRRLAVEMAETLQQNVDAKHLWKGRHAKLVDGFTFTMPDTEANQAEYPQNPSQKKGLGTPIARACVVLSLATACMLDLAIGPYSGKETGETALLREMLDSFNPGDVVVFDRCFCSYMMIALLAARDVDVCVRLHPKRDSDFRRGKRLGEDDHLITWTRPAKPKWMDVETYNKIPETLQLRESRFCVEEPSRVDEITVVTTLLDPDEYSATDVAELLGYRWNSELDIRDIKQTLNLDHVRCKSPAMVRRELWTTLLGYNLIRETIVVAATLHGKTPRQISFTGACQAVLSSWMLFSTGSSRDAQAMCAGLLRQIASNTVADRPGRIEPRVIKRRRHRYPLMRKPRDHLKQQLHKS